MTATQGTTTWLRALRAYFAFTIVADLAWEAAQLPLYTIRATGTAGEQAFAVLHCTAGDALIATGVLVLALVAAGDPEWPVAGFRRVTWLGVMGGLTYTAYSEWLNTVVRHAWTYSALMPVLRFGGVGVGVSPMLQWVIVPALAFAAARWSGAGVRTRPLRSTG